MARLRVGVAPGTSTLNLGSCNGFGRCIPPAHPIDNGVQDFASRVAAVAQVIPVPAPVPGVVPTNPYGSQVELKGNGLGIMLVPYGYQQGKPPWEITATGYGQDRLGCDPQFNTHGEEGYYYDTPFGDYDKEPDNILLGRGMPTDAELSIDTDYMPILTQMLPTADGRLVPLPWIPPDGWNPALDYGPQAYPPGGALGRWGLRGLGDDVRSPTSTRSEVRSPTSTSTEVRSPTSTSTEVRSPTSTSTDAYTAGNVTVTGGAGAGATTRVSIFPSSPPSAAEHETWLRGRMHPVKRATDIDLERGLGPQRPLLTRATDLNLGPSRGPVDFTVRHQNRMFVLGVIGTAASVALASTFLLSRLFGRGA